MSIRVASRDVDLLLALADCRVLTARQGAYVFQQSLKSLRRRVGQLVGAGLVSESTRAALSSPGRREKVYSLARGGFDLLAERGEIPQDQTFDGFDADALHCVEHELLLSWFRIHLQRVEELLPHLTCESLSGSSPLAPVDASGVPLLYIRLPERDDIDGLGDPQDANMIHFKPDGVFRITDARSGKSALFFLEVDMGTEPLRSSEPGRSDVAGKIANYQQYAVSGGFRTFGDFWKHEFTGFRLLFLTKTSERMAAICRLVHDAPPSDFVWITDEERMFSQGLGDAIWSRGGHGADRPPESILNWSLARPTPLPPLQG